MTVRKIVDAAVTRLHELKEELKQIELSEIHYIDGAMIELKLVPHDVEIIHPALCYPRPIDVQDLWERIQVSPVRPLIRIQQLLIVERGEDIHPSSAAADASART